jgi:hypothetical protein
MSIALKFTVVMLTSIFTGTSCRTPEAKQNTSPIPAYGATVSCFLKVSGQLSRCTEYGPGIDNNMKHAAKIICGQKENGLDGYMWQDSSCPTTQIVGDCEAKDKSKTVYTHNFFYYPAYTKVTAHSICDGADYLLKEYP